MCLKVQLHSEVEGGRDNNEWKSCCCCCCPMLLLLPSLSFGETQSTLSFPFAPPSEGLSLQVASREVWHCKNPVNNSFSLTVISTCSISHPPKDSSCPVTRPLKAPRCYIHLRWRFPAYWHTQSKCSKLHFLCIFSALDFVKLMIVTVQLGDRLNLLFNAGSGSGSGPAPIWIISRPARPVFYHSFWSNWVTKKLSKLRTRSALQQQVISFTRPCFWVTFVPTLLRRSNKSKYADCGSFIYYMFKTDYPWKHIWAYSTWCSLLSVTCPLLSFAHLWHKRIDWPITQQDIKCTLHSDIEAIKCTMCKGKVNAKLCPMFISTKSSSRPTSTQEAFGCFKPFYGDPSKIIQDQLRASKSVRECPIVAEGVLRAIQGCTGGVPGVFWGCFEVVLRVSKGIKEQTLVTGYNFAFSNSAQFTYCTTLDIVQWRVQQRVERVFMTWSGLLLHPSTPLLPLARSQSPNVTRTWVQVPQVAHELC